MQFIDGKKIISLLFISSLAFAGSTCRKKIARYPFEMEGVWYANTTCCSVLLKIEKNGTGKMFAHKGHWCSRGETHAQGAVKFRNNILFIGKTKFIVSSKPKITTIDSIYAPDEIDFNTNNTKKQKVLAEMTIHDKKEGDCTQYTFFKYIDY